MRKKRKQIEAQREAALLEAKNLEVADSIKKATDSLKNATKTFLVDTGVLKQSTVDEGFDLSKSVAKEAGKFVHHLKEVVDDKSFNESIFDLKYAITQFTAIFKVFFGLHNKYDGDHKHETAHKHKHTEDHNHPKVQKNESQHLQRLHMTSYKKRHTSAQKKNEEQYSKTVEQEYEEYKAKQHQLRKEQRKKQMALVHKNRPKFKLVLGYHSALVAKRRLEEKLKKAPKKRVSRVANRIIVSASKRPLTLKRQK